ncbi:DoxX family protein [Streptomyces longispororuber]|uniref:DoxX family protein n=1 Tax=Streptomyces longispororuber TaxID=68230 RepID=UPI0021091F77|nr:DoxX family protein [Streptomyces longispororuber]MCQ4208779.1 DoxX family protein [Streptomyces longispororuber]
MEPLVALLVGFGAARVAGLAGIDVLNAWQPALRVGLAAMFLLTAFAHFYPKLRADLIGMVPPALPRPGLLVTLTGILELAGAVGVLVPATKRLAAICLVALLIAMFPANVSAARRGVAQGDAIGPRTALQVVFVAAAALVIP